MAFEKVKVGTWEPSEGDVVEGVLVKVEEDIGAHNSKMYHIKTEDGPLSVWGSTMLDLIMEFIPVGMKIRITFKGLGKAKGGNKPPKLFDVEQDPEYRDTPRGPEGQKIEPEEIP